MEGSGRRGEGGEEKEEEGREGEGIGWCPIHDFLHDTPDWHLIQWHGYQIFPWGTNPKDLPLPSLPFLSSSHSSSLFLFPPFSFSSPSIGC